LKAIKLLKKMLSNVHLTICGEGPEKERLINLIYELGLVNDVRMTGFISSSKLPSYYQAADFFILPTRCLEGFGLVTPEAMACGTPVLGTPIGGTKEILSRFNSKFLFASPAPEAMALGMHKIIQKYIDDPEKYHNLRNSCRDYVEKNYSWKRHVELLETTLDEIMCCEKGHSI
jgi:glycosyltransferase involved in cell wall biosynthesis